MFLAMLILHRPLAKAILQNMTINLYKHYMFAYSFC